MALAPVIKIVEFAKERDPSIDKMIQQMENQKPSHKRVFQKLPKHLRRRAMSYDVKKVPRSMRPTVEEQIKGAAEAKARNKPAGRDPNKYRQNGQNLMIHRNHEFKWLESHLWHAKRFHMLDMWGWKIPWAPTMKQTRSLIKMTKENCTMRDISYMVIISIKLAINNENHQILQPTAETKNILCEKLSSFLRPNARIETTNRILFPVELFKPHQFPNSAIGPVQIFWVDDNNFWIICHPLLNDKIVESFSSIEFSEGEDYVVDIEIINGELNIYEIFGPKSSDAISSVLQPNAKETPENVVKIINTLPGPSSVPPGLSIGYVSNDPRTIATDNEENPDSAPFDFKLLDAPYLCESSLFRDRSFTFKSESEFNSERSKLLFPKAECPSGSIPVILMQEFSTPSGFPSSSIGFGSSWLVILPFGCGNVVFRKFVHHGVRIFGLECSKLIDLESGRFNFPYDRPETESGRQIFKSEVAEMNETNEKRPPGKRRGLNIYQFPDDFFISESVESESAYVRVGLLMVKRGTPSRFSTVYLPEPEDYRMFDESLIKEITGERRPIGIVMCGNSSLLAGDGRGLAIVRSQALSHFLPEREAEVNFRFGKRPKDSRLAVVREQGSQFLHLAWIWIHPSNFFP